ncbi:MAG: carbohydrate ABC transporter permease [Clostridiales bacterium]|nr:carbohydrate ABC transporter permease [Clostridiales bacterium]
MKIFHFHRRVSRSLGGNLAANLFLLIGGAFTALPLIYAILNSFKPLNELFLYPPRFFVQNPTLENYSGLMRLQQELLVPIERYAFNSIFISLVTTVGYVLIAALAAYPLAKHRFRGKIFLTQLVVFAILFRSEVTAIPQYVIMAKLGMVDSYWAVILPAMATSFGVFLMKQFMESIPAEILESARMDGAGEWRTLWTVVMPMVKPAWLTLVIFTFQGIWNNTGVQYLYTETYKTLPTALSQISSAGIARAGVASAIAVILMLPPILLFLISQGSVIETMAHSGLKE